MTSLIIYSIIRNGCSITQYGILWWLTCLSAIWGFLSLCKLLNGIHLTFIDNVSIGTIVIMGLHKMFIGTTNFILTKALQIEGEITYPLIITFILAIVFVVMEYPIIILFKNYLPFMLGKNTVAK